MTMISHESILKMGRYRNLSIGGVETKRVEGLYRFMLRLRRCQEALIREYHPADEMRCPVHFCIGQEAVPAALSLLLAPDDCLFSHHRSHGYFLAKGASMKSLFAELYGRETGANGGKAGSQDISMHSVNFYSGAILAGAVAIAVGAGLGFQLKRRPSVVVTGFGDGAPDEGIFWEAINYAVLHKLPVVFLCENNRYSTYSHQLKRQPADNISQRVAAFGMSTCALFGNDVIAVYSAVAEAMRHARTGQGPFFIEAYTYRWNSHVGPEDDSYIGYRPESELELWKTNCPIALLEEQMVACGLLTSTVKKAIIDEIDAEIDEALGFAKSSPFPNITDWSRANYSGVSPLADKLLRDVELSEFDQNQADTLPRPY
jgi:TPP-dependent pyruvate/acetoin dehydrogenase alpha subunit